MSYKNIYGTGGVVFQDLINQGEYIYFPTAVATISQERIYKKITQNKGRNIIKHKGWRLHHTITINNFCDDDYINILKLLENIKYMTNQTGLDKAIYYYPKVASFYEGFELNNKNYRVIADKMTIKFSKIADTIKQGEILTITFTSIGLNNNLQINSNILNKTLVDHNGSNIITRDGGRLVANSED